MQFLLLSNILTLSLLTIAVKANPVPVDIEANNISQFLHWLATTDANITWVGEPINPLTSRAALNTMVTYCNRRTVNVCGGSCTIYNGSARCLSAPGTACLGATQNVGFCDKGSCTGSCNQLSSCGTRLDNNFCYTPGTNSINVGNA